MKRFFSVSRSGPGIGRLPKGGARSLALEPCKKKSEDLLSGMQQIELKVTLKFYVGQKYNLIFSYFFYDSSHHIKFWFWCYNQKTEGTGEKQRCCILVTW